MVIPLTIVMRSTVAVLAAATSLAVATPAAAQVDPLEIIDRVDRLLRGDSSRGVATMEVVTEHWERQMTMEIWSLGTDYSLVRLRAPQREAGTATLKAEADIWNYLPKVDRTIKVPASMMGGAWMGSHFTNDDLVKESQLVEDYDIELAFDGDESGRREHLGVPADAEARRGRRVGQHRIPASGRATTCRCGREVLRRGRRAGAHDGARRIPGVRRPHGARRHEHASFADKPDERTTIRYEELEFDVDLEPSFFSLRSLQRGR